jgi:hypothetical protein
MCQDACSRVTGLRWLSPDAVRDSPRRSRRTHTDVRHITGLLGRSNRGLSLRIELFPKCLWTIPGGRASSMPARTRRRPHRGITARAALRPLRIVSNVTTVRHSTRLGMVIRRYAQPVWHARDCYERTATSRHKTRRNVIVYPNDPFAIPARRSNASS